MLKQKVVLASVLLASILGIQPLALAEEDFEKGPELTREDGFLPLNTYFGKVLYPPSYLDRASRLMDRIELTGVDLYVWSKYAVKVDILVFDLANWRERYPDRLYGLPTRVSPTSIAIAAAGTPGTVRVWQMLLGRPVPPAAGVPVIGTPEEAMTLIYCDLMLQLELGKIFAEQSGYGSGQAQWPVHVMAHLTVIELLEKHDAGQLLVYDDLFATWAQDPGPYPLEPDLDKLPIARQLWHQAQYLRGAGMIRAEDASHAVKKIQRKMRKRKERQPDEVLLELYPELAGWLEESFGPPTVN